jgi:hypothetical protein
VEKLIAATRKLRYRVFLLTTYSMGLQYACALRSKHLEIFQT